MNTLQNRAGFTLIELAVSLALLGLMMGLIGSALPLTVDSAARSKSLDDELAAVQTAQDLLRRQIGEMPAIAARQAHGQRVMFFGEASGMRFPANPVAALGPGGPQWIALSVAKSASGEALVYTMAGESRALVHAAQDIRFAYFGAEEEGKDSAWHDAWKNTQHLPVLVRIQVQLKEAAYPWPDLVIHLQTDFSGP